eukprot:NODE_4908_length_1096_cov_84.447071_g4360_i0.p1 GENE.NODE_4908_length_1096_cov_84.447071_g4360_i0~~NODE_4908_length_1096_cov_84.447071_g4360_i0.p1  ORF type:complete len:298 (-),score=84.80 NODE_4908_length_1096_cov_84.447071_g4360_i0:144-1037(-)
MAYRYESARLPYSGSSIDYQSSVLNGYPLGAGSYRGYSRYGLDSVYSRIGGGLDYTGYPSSRIGATPLSASLLDSNRALPPPPPAPPAPSSIAAAETAAINQDRNDALLNDPRFQAAYEAELKKLVAEGKLSQEAMTIALQHRGTPYRTVSASPVGSQAAVESTARRSPVDVPRTRSRSAGPPPSKALERALARDNAFKNHPHFTKNSSTFVSKTDRFGELYRPSTGPTPTAYEIHNHELKQSQKGGAKHAFDSQVPQLLFHKLHERTNGPAPGQYGADFSSFVPQVYLSNSVSGPR